MATRRTTKAIVKGKVEREGSNPPSLTTEQADRLHLIMDAIQLQLLVLRKAAEECGHKLYFKQAKDGKLEIYLQS